MTPPQATLAESHQTTAVDTTAVVPVRADGVQLLGQLEGSGYEHPRFLVRRGDGQTLHLTSLLYATLACVDGTRTIAEIAACLTAETDRQLLDEDVQCLLDEKLSPLGLLVANDGAQPVADKANPLLGLRFRFIVTNPNVTRRITRPFAALFRPIVAAPMLAMFAIISIWLLLEKGLASATHQALYSPGLLLLLFALTIVSAGFHEFGHAAACRYGGATPGVMGAGLYLVWPAFYTDVTDSYRLGRWGRVRVDVGGLYFNAIFAAGTFAVWWVTRSDALLLVIPAQLLQMVRQLLPFVRFDGYHILADLTGVPDLFAHMKPTLLGLLPSRWGRREPRPLKRWARWVVTAWVLLVVPVLLFSLFMMVKVMPRVLATVWDSLGVQYRAMLEQWATGSFVDVVARILSMFALALPAAATLYMTYRIASRTARRVWRSTDGRPTRRSAAVLAALLIVGLVAWLWWPQGQYRPIEANERGTLLDAIPGMQVQPTLASTPTSLFATSAPTLTELEEGMAPPADAAPQPQLALLFTTQGSATPDQIVLLPPPDEVAPAEGVEWPFPFNEPREARSQDNQSRAVNTTDGSTLYDVALAMVWVRDGSTVDHRNDAYALASCTACTTVAVAFQVVMIIGQSDVIVPQNVAVAVNYDCVACTTYALAVQLIATLSGMPSDEAVATLDAIWDELEAFARDIEDVPLSEIHTRLASVESAILGVLGSDDGAGATADESSAVDEGSTTSTAPDSTTDSGDTDGAVDPTEDSAAPEEAAAPTTVPQDEAAAEPEPSPSSSPEAQPTEQASPASAP